MHYLLIILLLTTISCKKENYIDSTSARGGEIRSAFTIQNGENPSLIRGKILNSFVEEKFPSNTKVNVFALHDELKGLNLNQSEMNDYMAIEKSRAKLIVSYEDRTEIYFLPGNFPLSKVESFLKLPNDPTRVFKWINSSNSTTTIGQTFYLASVNLDDLVKNDQDFYFNKSEKTIGSEGIKLLAGQRLQVSLQHEAYIQRTKGQWVVMNPQGGCPVYGRCDICTYQMPTPADEIEKTTPIKYQDLKFVIRQDGNIIELNDLVTKFIGTNKFTFSLSSNDENSLIALELDSRLEDVEKRAVPFDSNQFCVGLQEGVMRLKRVLDVKTEIKILGRGRELLKSVL